MKELFWGFSTAFSLYSAIPMPRTPWNRDGMRYALCFFPLVGVPIGVLLYLWYLLCAHFALSGGLFAAVAVLLPPLVSGGIHMDGLVDTMDALSSRAPTDQKLSILQDPHVGAFGVMGCVLYLLLQFGLWTQLYQAPSLLLVPVAGYLLSRSLNGLSIALFPCARRSGLVHAFSTAAAQRAAVILCAVWAGVACAIFLYSSPLWGGLLILLAGGYFAMHRAFCLREFGGNTGDLAGFLLQTVELLCLILAVIGGAAA